MIPGISARPSASTVSRAAPRILPISTILPSLTATPPRRGGEPSPSSSSASRITRSNIAAQYTSARMKMLRADRTRPPSSPAARKGIGAATAKLLREGGRARRGARTSRRGCDVTDEDAGRARRSPASARIDILVNNAGTRRAQDLPWRSAREEWQSVIDLNLTALFLCSRLAASLHEEARRRRDRQPRLDHGSFRRHLSRTPPTRRRRAAVVNLTRALALEWAADNIRVNAVAPTYVRTDLTAPIFSNPEVLKTVMAHTPLGRAARDRRHRRGDPLPRAATPRAASPASRCRWIRGYLAR